jgi:hypothetical protein
LTNDHASIGKEINMNLGSIFWFVGGILFVIAAVIAGIHAAIFWVLLGVACGFFGVAFGGVAFPAVVRQAPPA